MFLKNIAIWTFLLNVLFRLCSMAQYYPSGNFWNYLFLLCALSLKLDSYSLLQTVADRWNSLSDNLMLFKNSKYIWMISIEGVIELDSILEKDWRYQKILQNTKLLSNYEIKVLSPTSFWIHHYKTFSRFLYCVVKIICRSLKLII